MQILQTGYGVGDVLLASGVLRGWRRLNGKRAGVFTRFPELYRHNPDAVFVFPEQLYFRMVQALGKPALWRLGSALNGYRSRRLLKPAYPFPCSGRHLIDAMAEAVGVSLLPDERRPFLYLTRQERRAQRWAEGWVAVQSSSSTYWTPNKNWIPGRMQAVVNELKRLGYAVIHLGASEEEPLQGVKDLRGRTTLRQGAAILANARLFIGLEGGLAHTARAVDTPAVVIYTGYTLPEETGYPEHSNLRFAGAGPGCWRRDPCPHCRQAAEQISVDDVMTAALIHL